MHVDWSETSHLVLKTYIQNLSQLPGVYRFYNQKRELLYVGKAKNLKKRVSSYLRTQKSTRIHALVSQIAHIEVTITQTENDALLLESNLIKSLQPHYNVLLRDDKTYPYLVLSTHLTYPRLYHYRGKPKRKEEYFGPYPNIIAMRESLALLQKIFKLRSCQDTFFKNRTRPCLQYQIQRCTAPCVGLISAEAYQKEVQKVRLLLQGKSQKVMHSLSQQMEAASVSQDYEKASHLLNQITSLRQVQQQQSIITSKGNNLDVISADFQAGICCIYVLPIRNGQMLSGHAYFPTVPSFLEKPAILSQFISQFYTHTLHIFPEQLLVDTLVEEQTWLAHALSKQHDAPFKIRNRPLKSEMEWLKSAQQNTQEALQQALSSQQQQKNQRHALQEALQLHTFPTRLECFDISHSQGEATVASCVVFDANGPAKKEYRQFNIKNITPGDDYAAMNQALMRRYADWKNQRLPDLLIIDGGKGQLKQAIEVLTELQCINQIQLLAIAKGPARKAGEETLFSTPKASEVTLAPHHPALHLLQYIRDEAHRFAITNHRKKRAHTRKSSVLEKIPGIGPKRRQMLLTHFGGLQGLKRVSLHELAQIRGMTKKVAEQLYTYLHP